MLWHPIVTLYIRKVELVWDGHRCAGERGCASTYMRRSAPSYAVMCILHVGRFIHPCTNEVNGCCTRRLPAMIQNVARPSLSL